MAAIVLTYEHLTAALSSIGHAMGHITPVLFREPPTDPKATERTLARLDELMLKLEQEGAAAPMLAVVQGFLEGMARERFDQVGMKLPTNFGRT